MKKWKNFRYTMLEPYRCNTLRVLRVWDGRFTVTDELKRMWQEAFVITVKALCYPIVCLATLRKIPNVFESAKPNFGPVIECVKETKVSTFQP